MKTDSSTKRLTAEERRLEEARRRTKHWKRWGPYLSERAWGTVREDYSAYGAAWDYFPHDHARSRAYRWNEDGIAGISDRHQNICFALALWNGRDPILKERLFGLTGSEGNHGEDVKEYYFYLDSTPTHSYMKYLYKYPQSEFPYRQLVEENRQRGKQAAEFELIDTGLFNEDRYFDVLVEYAKAGVEDILIKITAINRGPEAATLNLLPTIWFRNTWSWHQNGTAKPHLRAVNDSVIELDVSGLGKRWLHCEGSAKLLFTENDTNTQRLFNFANGNHYVKDGINDYIVHGNQKAVNPDQRGTKAAANYKLTIPAGETMTIRLRLTDKSVRSPTVRESPVENPFADFDQIFANRVHEADEFYQTVIPKHLSHDARAVMRQAFAGMLWSKQFYHYVVEQWLDGDPDTPQPPAERKSGRNREWKQLYNPEGISMTGKCKDAWKEGWRALGRHSALEA